MGYYTRFELEVTGVEPDVSGKLWSDLGDLCVFNDMQGRGTDCVAASGWTTWYDYEKDMLALSVKYPGCFFELDGDGEDDDDLWKAYFQNGMTMRCQGYIQRHYDAFDKALMVRKIPPAAPAAMSVEWEDLI